MMKCVRHAEREARLYCQKTDRWFCDECGSRCFSSDAYCKFRTACVIWFTEHKRDPAGLLAGSGASKEKAIAPGAIKPASEIEEAKLSREPSPIYLDHNATTPLHPAVVEAMLPYLREHFGNPSSGHMYGQRAKRGVERAREQVASLLTCHPDEILFTSGGTEANNLAIPVDC